MKFSKVFITGGAGYVGSALVPALLAQGYSVVAYDLFLYGDVLDAHPNLTQVKGDIRDKDLLIKSAAGCDAMIHLACISNDPSYELDSELGKSINYDGFFNVLEAAKANGVKRFIYASSSSVYGLKDEPDVVEDAELTPLTDYSKFKAECEKILAQEDPDMEWVIVRPATICGYAPRLRLDLSVNILTINALVNKKIKIFGGSQLRPNITIFDMVRVYQTLLEADAERIHREVFNAGYQNLSIQKIAEMVKEVLGDDSVSFEVTPTDDVRSYHINSDKIKNVLGFEAAYTIQDAIKSIKDAYNEGKIEDGLTNSYYYNIKRMEEVSLE